MIRRLLVEDLPSIPFTRGLQKMVSTIWPEFATARRTRDVHVWSKMITTSRTRENTAKGLAWRSTRSKEDKHKAGYSRSIVGERGLRPSTWHRFLLEYLPHVLRRENQRRPRVVMRRRRWRSYARPVQLTSPVALEFDGASASGGGTRATPSTESEPWRPPSTHDSGAGQETAPLVGPRREAVRILLGQQASTFALPPFARRTLFAADRERP